MSQPVPPELAGSWRMVDLEERDGEDEPWDRPLGEDARGVFFADAAGVLSAHLHAPDAPEPANRSVGYFGFFTVRAVERTGDMLRGEMIYALDGGFPPEVLLDPDEPRPFEITGDRLVIGDQRTWRTTLTRIR